MKTRTLIATLAATLFASCTGRQAAQDLYVGTYGDAIHILSFNPAKGELSGVDQFPADNASYLALAEDNSVIYAVSEKGEDSGVYSFRKDGSWQQTAYNDATGADPCYILPIEGTDLVATADYTGGALTVFRTENNVICGVEQHDVYPFIYAGTDAPVPARQESAHIHQIKEIPADICRAVGAKGRFFLVSDLGNDLIRIKKLDDESSVLEEVGTISCGPGAGPRHMEFNPESCKLYYICELSGEVLVWQIGAQDGIPTLAEVQRIAAGNPEAQGSADIHMHPGGKWLYTSHRNIDDGITVFSIAPDGLITKIGYTLTGPHPRNFTISPDGKWMLVACRDSQSIQVYGIDQSTGLLSEMRSEYVFESDKPVCLIFGK